MEKILKKILYFIVPLTFSFLFINNVKAESIDFYINFRTISTNGIAFYDSSTVPNISDFSITHNLNLYNEDINFNVNSRAIKNYNSFVFYDYTKNVYIFTNFGLTTTNYSSTDSSYNITCNINANPTLSYKNDSNEWVDGTTSNLPVRSFLFSDNQFSNEYLSTFYGDTSNILSFNSNNFYFSAHKYQAFQLNSNRYICDNLENLRLIYKYMNNIYVNGDPVKLYSTSEPEPEPEPEEPTIPPYNFNDNKYYVPNYHEGQCVEILDKDTIRVFDDNSTSFYTDYFINSNYISKTGQVDLSYEKQCSTLEFTDIRYYGNDFPQILIITLVIITFTIGFPYILYKRFRKR